MLLFARRDFVLGSTRNQRSFVADNLIVKPRSAADNQSFRLTPASGKADPDQRIDNADARGRQSENR